MRVKLLTLNLALVIGVSSVGCKSAPKLPWFSSADTAAAGAPAATTASKAPQLPSEIAKQAEGLAAGADPVKITTTPATTMAKTSGGPAPGYAASATPGAYPSTGAQDYLSNSAATLKSAASTAAAHTAAAKSALPYDPSAVPPSTAALAGGTPNSAPPTVDRYGSPDQDRYANSYPSTTPAYSPGSFPTSTAPNDAPSVGTAGAAPTTGGVPLASNSGTTALGDRYATQATPPAALASSAVPSYSAPVQTASAVASVQPYRPGGTSSYPGTSASYEVATRPGSTTTSTTPSGTLYR